MGHEKIPRGVAEESTSQWQLRLAISIPALLVLFTLAYGLISYQLFSAHWSALDRGGVGEHARTLLRGHLYGMLGLSLLGLFMGVGLAFTILRPIQAINETARLIAKGRLGERAPKVPASREIGDLSRSFNSMIDVLNESIQERNRYLMEGIMTGVLTVDLNGRITALNSTGAHILGLKSADVVGRTAVELKKMNEGRTPSIWAFLELALRQDKTQISEEIAIHGDGGSVALLAATSFLRDSEGIPLGLMLNFRDAGEIRRLNAQLSKTDQLAALGTFTMGLAHELRNPMGSIKGTIQLLKLKQGSEPESGEYLDRVVREVDRLDGFIRELLDFSHQSPTPPTPTDLNQSLRSAVHLARDAARTPHTDSIELLLDLEALPPVLAEPERLAQAFANIIRNDFEAVRPGSRIVLRTEARMEPAGPSVLVRIHNTGSTIAPEHREKIFDPFFSTKEHGSGLGLAVAYQIISQNQGTIDLAVGPDEVTFIIRFAAIRDAAALPAEADSAFKADAA